MFALRCQPFRGRTGLHMSGLTEVERFWKVERICRWTMGMKHCALQVRSSNIRHCRWAPSILRREPMTDLHPSQESSICDAEARSEGLAPSPLAAEYQIVRPGLFLRGTTGAALLRCPHQWWNKAIDHAYHPISLSPGFRTGRAMTNILSHTVNVPIQCSLERN